MKILLCHNHFQQPGGEDQSFEDEARLLEARGNQVLRFTLHNDAIHQMNRLRLAARTMWHGDVYRRLRHLMRAERPQVMHCTNTFPLISPAAYYAARAENVPVVQSLRNYRPLCANGFLLRDGRVCEDCVGRCAPWPGVLHRCYRADASATAIVTLMIGAHRALGTWQSAVDLYFTPSEFARRKFIAGGFAPDSIAVKPNFVFPDPHAGTGTAGGAIFVGRLSPEKGIQTLLDAWLHHAPPLPLKIVGDGPLADRVRDACRRSEHIVWVGRRSIGEVLDQIGEAALLVSPSIWYETFGRTLIEAFAKGTPVVSSSDGGASTELVAPGRTGLHFRTNDPADLAAKVREVVEHPAQLAMMREHARQEYLRKYTADANYEILMGIYDRAIARAQERRNRSRARGGGWGTPSSAQVNVEREGDVSS
jgi:glycosyltransferase involved in cell wall biosynthesis